MKKTLPASLLSLGLYIDLGRWESILKEFEWLEKQILVMFSIYFVKDCRFYFACVTGANLY